MAEEDHLDELAAELRQRMARELREEAEDVETETEVGRVRRRSLADVATELMHRGDTIVAGTTYTTVTGLVVHARGDLAVVQAGHALASVNLAGPVYLKVAERAKSGGASTARGGSGSFKARLGEFEHTGEPVRVIATGLAESIEGRVAAVASDHVVLIHRDGAEWFVPTTTIAMVLQPLNRR